LTITLPDRSAIEQLSQTLARLLLVGQQPPTNAPAVTHTSRFDATESVR
jgi:hypothetical protein